MKKRIPRLHRRDFRHLRVNNLVDGWTGDEHERVINEERADKLGFKNAKK